MDLIGIRRPFFNMSILCGYKAFNIFGSRFTKHDLV
jgi:hypothetical protein